MIRAILILLLFPLVTLLAVTLAAPAAAQAQPAIALTCVPREMIVERLRLELGEVQSGGGLTSSGDKDLVLEVFANPRTRTFTMLLTGAEGMSCYVLSGDDWSPEMMDEEL